MLGLIVVVALLVGGVAIAHHHPAGTHQVAPVDNPNNPNGFGSGTNFRLYPGDNENLVIENNRAAEEVPVAPSEDAPAE